MKTTLVVPTIHIPVLLPRYMQNASYYGHSDVDIIVIGNQISPPETEEFCRTIKHCNYLDIPAQKKYLDRFPRLWEHLVLNSASRRNVGMLLAYENGADVVVMVDDDNFVMGQDYVSAHGVVGTEREIDTYYSSTGWFNVCSFLQEANDTPFYHRGYPQGMRWKEADQFVSCQKTTRKIVINAGFWLDDPDVDALARMSRPLVVTGYQPGWRGNFALHPGTWSPFNSQNTAIMRDAIPAYFQSPYTDRYEDIWGAYLLERIAEHLGHVIAFGDPLVRQDRNPHDLWKDLDKERNGMIMSDEFCQLLRAISLAGSSYHECFGELTDGLKQDWDIGASWTDSQREWRARWLEGMEIWQEVFEKVERPQVATAKSAS